MLSSCRFPKQKCKEQVCGAWGNGLYLETDGHDNVWFALDWFVGFHSWIHKCDELVKDCLVDFTRTMRWSVPQLQLTFWISCFLLESFVFSELLSRAAFTLDLTLCRNEATSLTLTSDSSKAEVISLSVASRTCHYSVNFRRHNKFNSPFRRRPRPC